MRRCKLGCLALFVVAALSRPALAEFLSSAITHATAVECGDLVNCGHSDNQVGTTFAFASASYNNPFGGSSSANARANVTEAELALKAFATATGFKSDTNITANRASASASIIDTVTFTGSLLDLEFRYTFSLSGSAQGDTLFDAGASVCFLRSGESVCNDPNAVVSTPGLVQITSPRSVDPDEPAILSVYLDVNATGHGQDGPMSSTIDFGHTMKLLSIEALDANGNHVPGVTILSESGFNYNQFQVPEPNTLLLAAAVFFAPLLSRRR